MSEKLKYLFIGLLVTAAAGFFGACDDDQTEIDEWTANYVYLERPVLGLDSKSYHLTHTESGVAGDTEISMPVTVRLSKPYKSDVRVTLGYAAGADMPEEVVSFLKGGTVVIPAGELFTRDTLNIHTNWAFVPDSKVSYTTTVSIQSIEPVSDDLRISSRQSSLHLVVNKEAFLNMSFSISSVPPGSSISNRAAWTIEIQPEVENANNPGRLVDGSTSTDIATNMSSLWFTVNLNKTATVTGFHIRHWGAAYAPQAIEIYTSGDGANWRSQGRMSTSGSNQYIRFLSPVTCSHVKYEVVTGATSGRLSVTEFYVYEQL